MILIIDNTHIASVFITQPNISYISDDMDYAVRYNDCIFHGLEYYHNVKDNERNFVVIGGANIPSIVKTSFNKLAGMIELPRNKVNFVGLEDYWGSHMAHLLQADFKKNNWTVAEFFARPETKIAIPRFRIYSRKDLVERAKAYTKKDVNLQIKEVG